MATHGIVPEQAARAARGGLTPLARWLHAAGVTANTVTAVGLILTVAGAVALATGAVGLALIVLILGSLGDTLDGAIARASGTGTRLGAFLDSTADRVADAAIFSAAAWLGAARGDPILFWSAIGAVVTAGLVPYARAKAESLGVTAAVGFAPREARLAVFLIGLALWAALALPEAFTAGVAAVAILAAITFVQRVAVVVRTLARG
jgi:phosphatidylinositol phosphate synthase